MDAIQENNIEELAVFGDRKLLAGDDPFKHNAWDKVDWSEEQEKEAIALLDIQKQSSGTADLSLFDDELAATQWNAFYTINENKFFKDRHWLGREFPKVFADLPTKESKKQFVFLEIGCGTGATVFPLMEETKESNVFVHCCDYSSVAVGLVKENSLYDTKRCNAFVFDLTSDLPPKEIEKGSVDVISLIFVMSALKPSTWPNAMSNLNYLLKQGGQVIFRDYGRYDMAQMRFKPNRVIGDNFYVRGDNTRCYFFTTDEVEGIFCDVGGMQGECGVERKMIVNRLKRIKMFRHWVQGQFVKQ